MNEEQIQAARDAFNRDPETACQAMLGCSAEDMFVTALRGCNQYGHKPGCQHRKNFREQAFAEYQQKLQEIIKKYGRYSPKIDELDAELLAKLKSKNANA